MYPFMRLLVGVVFISGAASAADWSPDGRPDRIDQWEGGTRHSFAIAGCQAWVVEPPKAAEGQPWAWSLRFPTAFTKQCAITELIARGFHIGYIDVGNTFACPKALDQFDAFYRQLVSHGLAAKVSLIGLSRGGLNAYRWAARNPDSVALIYGDAPVCDFKSWPGGKVGQGKGSPKDWAQLLSSYDFKTEAEALAFTGNPIDTLEPLAKRKIPLIHVVGDDDDVVPVADNTAVLAERYQKLGGSIQVIHKPGVKHHPHGLTDPTPVVEFIISHQPKDLPVK